MTTAASQEEPKKTIKRDVLMSIEAQMQKRWEDQHIFEVDAPEAGSAAYEAKEKYLMTFPYPYMNGRLHLGHTFSLSKCEFAAGYERLKGKLVLFPFAFHCTGMPIKACADKLKREIELYGNPPKFPVETATAEDSAVVVAESAPSGNPAAGQIRKKGKVAAKSTGKKYQWEIMKSMGVAEDEIHKFADATYWLYYFPPHAMTDLKRLGVKVDWRRAFITTDINPYYDSFVRWQFRKLKALDKIKFGKRYTIFSPLDNQPCMDHDRQTGEGVLPQEYTLIKLQLVANPLPESLKSIQGKRIYLTAATLRPETMYGQTNCFVGPELEYGAYQISDDEVFICTERSALNLAYQGYAQQEGKIKKLASLTGKDLVGLPVKAPLSKYDHVYVLPMESVLATKGTGVVTSVPSDSPDDYATLADLKKKCSFYGIKEEWVASYEPVPIIETPTYGNLSAKAVVEELKINSPKDRKQLDIAKEKVYQEGFYKGILIVGEFAGKQVQDAKPLIRKSLIDQNLACPYWEPEGVVMSRSGDECVVCLTDQWYLNYGEESWKQDALKCLEKMETFHPEVRAGFQRTLDWLREWACSRSYGLGSRLPWDEQWLIESLSDSTVYMAYYTVAHFLQSYALDGSKSGLLGIKPEQLTDDVWDYVFSPKASFPKTDIPTNVLNKLRNEFMFFYPMDLRVTGKDLVPNHLTFSIYNHVAIFDESLWPLGMRANGHLLINNEKMSKSTGNFLTLSESVEKFSADATRFALAQSGDGVDDANFEFEVANAAILRLFNLKEWIEQTLQDIKDGKLRSGPCDTFQDKVFENEMNNLIRIADGAYKNMRYFDAMKAAFHQFTGIKDRYVLMSSTLGVSMHAELVKKYIRNQCLIVSPVIPHFSEYIWSVLLAEPKSIMTASWPTVSGVDETIIAANAYVEKVIRETRLAFIAETQPKKKKKANVPDVPIVPPTAVEFYLATSYPQWQVDAVEIIKHVFANYKSGDVMDMKLVLEQTKNDPKTAAHLKNKKYLSFVKGMLNAVETAGSLKALDRLLPFDEREIFDLNAEFIKMSLNMKELKTVDAADVQDNTKAGAAEPGNPSFQFLQGN